MSSYSVLIIGAGKIGAFFDTPQSEEVLTHAHAFSKHPGFHLLGFVDTNIDLAEQAAGIWGGEAFTSVAEAFSRNTIDVAIVATPDKFHYAILKELAAHPLRLVFAEKPLTTLLASSEEIVGLYRERKISLAVNYTRRFVPEFIALHNEIRSGTLGGFLSGTGYYGKGTLHNGSHLIDLLRFLLGDITEIQTTSSIQDFYDDDPSCSALLSLGQGGTFTMQAVDCRSYTVFELDLLFEQGRIRIVDAGFVIEVYHVHESAIFSGYRHLKQTESLETTLGKAFACAAEAIHTHLMTGAPLPCTGTDGLLAQQICGSIQRGQQ
jgi:predicted dehydrogenase